MPVRAPEPQTDPWGLPRRFVIATAAVMAGLVWTHSLAGVLRHLGPADAPLAAWPLTVAAALVALAGAGFAPRRGAALAAAVVGAAAILFLEALLPGTWAAALALVPAGAGAAAGSAWLGRRLPREVDGVLSRRRAAAVAWAVIALVAVVQTGRLAVFMTDPSHGLFLTTSNPFWNGHQCLGAYLHGAELAERGAADLYDPGHWPALDAEAAPETRVAGMVVEDPYQYPPQFLLLPRLALALSHDYATVRLAWFGLQVTLFAGVAAWLALWSGGRAGRLALWLLPLTFAAFPMLHNFQFGQFHLPAVALAVAAMLAFEARRRALGGGLLAVAILAKMFPAVLLLPLLARRRWKELAWTAGWGLAATALALAVLGPAPFTAFFDHHLPRLADGAAFAFDEAWPELADLVVADNQGVFGVVTKLGWLGVPGLDKGAAAMVSRVFTAGLLLAALLLGRRRGVGGRAPRLVRGTFWLALLGLGSLASPGAWGDYVPVTAVWLLTLLAARAAGSRPLAAALGTTALFQAFLLGTMPLGDWMPYEVMVPLSLVGALTLLGLFAATAAARPEALAGEGAAVEPAVEPAALARAA
jgi:alpha-1,2-mannosyltransferase